MRISTWSGSCPPDSRSWEPCRKLIKKLARNTHQMEIFISLKTIAACSSVQLQEPIDPPPAAAGNIFFCQQNASRNQRIQEATDRRWHKVLNQTNGSWCPEESWGTKPCFKMQFYSACLVFRKRSRWAFLFFPLLVKIPKLNQLKNLDKKTQFQMIIPARYKRPGETSFLEYEALHKITSVLNLSNNAGRQEERIMHPCLPSLESIKERTPGSYL
jgi:hypothetical protein